MCKPIFNSLLTYILIYSEIYVIYIPQCGSKIIQNQLAPSKIRLSLLFLQFVKKP